tara:strand:+ start:517 stop:732 length:216 start_codon:yes stop_codon:yes gene_type:complete
MSIVLNGDGFITGAAGVGTGGGTNVAFYETDNVISADYTIGTNKNAMSVGDITVATGVTVTVPTGAFWAVV